MIIIPKAGIATGPTIRAYRVIKFSDPKSEIFRVRESVLLRCGSPTTGSKSSSWMRLGPYKVSMEQHP